MVVAGYASQYLSQRDTGNNLCVQSLGMMNEKLKCIVQVAKQDFYSRNAPVNWFCICLPENHRGSTRFMSFQDLF